MDTLEQLAQAIAEAIDERRKHATACVSIRPKQIVGDRYTVYATAVVYIFDILTRVDSVKKQKLRKSVKYLICKDSKLYGMNKDEIKRKIIEMVEEYETRRER